MGMAGAPMYFAHTHCVLQLQFNYNSICYLSTKELNKEPLSLLQQLIAEDADATVPPLNCRLFGNRDEVRELLQIERELCCFVSFACWPIIQCGLYS